MTKRQRKVAEAESEQRTIIECIEMGGNFGEEMVGAKEERAVRAAK